MVLVQYNNPAMLPDIANRTVDDTVFYFVLFSWFSRRIFFRYKTTEKKMEDIKNVPTDPNTKIMVHVQIHIVEREQIITIESSKCCHLFLNFRKWRNKNSPLIEQPQASYLSLRFFDF